MLTVLDIIMHYIHDSYHVSPLKAGFMCTFILTPTVLPETWQLVFLKLHVTKPSHLKQMVQFWYSTMRWNMTSLRSLLLFFFYNYVSMQLWQPLFECYTCHVALSQSNIYPTPEHCGHFLKMELGKIGLQVITHHPSTRPFILDIKGQICLDICSSSPPRVLAVGFVLMQKMRLGRDSCPPACIAQ